MTEPDSNPVPSPEPDVSADAVAATDAAPGQLRPPTKGRSPLFVGGLAVLGATLAYYAYTTKTDRPEQMWFGLVIMTLAALPSLLWAERADYRFPVFEVFMLTGVNTYAIPLLSGQQQLSLFPEDVIATAAIGVILFQSVANIVYFTTPARPKRSRAWTEEVISRDISDYLAYGMIISTAYVIISQYTTWIPYAYDGVIRAACAGVGTMSAFIQSRMWGQGTLPQHQKASFMFMLIAQVFFSWTALYLIGGISMLVLATLGYVSGSKKVPVVAIVLILPVILVLHNGKNIMREKYWAGGAPAPTIVEIPAFYMEWIGYGTDPQQFEARKEQNNLLLERTSLFHILCLVVSNSPSPLPYLDGKTYGQVLPQFIPRPFWPGKPPSHISTYTLSIYYGLQQEEDTRKTTIAFGLLSEAYANYGYMGMVILGATFAFGFKKITGWAGHSPILSYPGLFLVVLMAWSFQSELTLAAWASSLYQACWAVLGIPFIVRNFLG